MALFKSTIYANKVSRTSRYVLTRIITKAKNSLIKYLVEWDKNTHRFYVLESNHMRCRKYHRDNNLPAFISSDGMLQTWDIDGNEIEILDARRQ